MAKLTEADKRDFVHFIIGILEENAETIANEGKEGVTFDTDGYKTLNEEKNQAIKTEEAKEKAIEEQKQKQVAKTNEMLDDGYKTASTTADAIVGHMGNDHTLSHIIRKERPGMHHDGGSDDDGSGDDGSGTE